MTSTHAAKPAPAATARARLHHAWWIAAVTGLVIVVTGATTGMPDLLTDPLRAEFGWSRATIGAAFALNMALYGVTAPFAAALMDRVGIRHVVVGALAIAAVGAALTALISDRWGLIVGWGLLLGLGTGSLALTFAATITNRWFVARTGVVTGALTSAGMFGGMGLMPVLAALVQHAGWRAAVIGVGLAALALVPIIWSLLRDHPADLGMTAYGATEFSPKPAPPRGADRRAFLVLRGAAGTRPFWLLVGTYGVCGASTNGIMMTHFVPFAADHGMPSTVAASLLALMGVCNIAGAIGSGWFTDRVDPRRLLAICYALRGVSLAVLPVLMASTVRPPLLVFCVGYGLLDLATVPPTIALCREVCGRITGPVIFGWVSAAHALGAGAAAFAGSAARGALGSYTIVWVVAAALCAVAALMSLGLNAAPHRATRPA